MEKKRLKSESSLSQERQNEIAHAITDYYLRENFRFVSNGDYRRKLGTMAQLLGVSSDELHEFILSKLPTLMSEMFGWDKCSLMVHDKAR